MPSIINQRRVKSSYTEIPSATVTETPPEILAQARSKSFDSEQIRRNNEAATLNKPCPWAGAPGIDASILPKEQGPTLTKKRR